MRRSPLPLRWRVAEFLNRSGRYCWADLVGWAQKSDGYSLRLREQRGGQCRIESATHQHGSCYCSKFRNGCQSSSVASTEVKP